MCSVRYQKVGQNTVFMLLFQGLRLWDCGEVMNFSAPSTVPSPEIEASGMTITIHRPPQSQGRVECYYVVLFRMTLTETIEDIQV